MIFEPSVIDLKDGYFQADVAEKYREKMASLVGIGRLMQFGKMPHGFKNSPAFFQGGMQFVPKGPIPCKCVVYIDYILVFGSNKEEHDRNFKGVMYRLKLYNLTVNQEKLIYDAENATFLGYSIAMNAMKLLRTGPMGIRN